ncbi:uncharacterized protein LOC126735698 isoform X2 [Anthonomus grandis grandis]|uniref:uncharacterized protein LOC126735698 isoform X2 n=1 Tax=Anthonomus grandis grandis TaxID=2921223 RepID=UPI002166B605|nr:uncharacterized protein LOC126735698 isoform X2 [Anthonomus grandis grandis]
MLSKINDSKISAGFTMSTQPVPSEKKINIDFGETRRRSFFPEGFVDNKDPNFRSVKVLECQEDDDLFMYMGVETGDRSLRDQPLRKFCTGSKYVGQWNKLGIAGKGGVTMTKNYCVMPDRRFQIEIENDFRPPGQEYLTNEPPPAREIPPECYDVVEGYFDPRTKTIYSYSKEMRSRSKLSQTEDALKRTKSMSASAFIYAGDDKKAEAIRKVSHKTESDVDFKYMMKRKMCQSKKVVSWIPSPVQEDWVLKNCRKAWDTTTGYRPDLFEEWTKGGTGFVTLNNIDENVSNFQSKLEYLKLSINPSEERNEKLLVSFVKNNRETQENVHVNILSKMFLEKNQTKEERPPRVDEIDNSYYDQDLI